MDNSPAPSEAAMVAAQKAFSAMSITDCVNTSPIEAIAVVIDTFAAERVREAVERCGDICVEFGMSEKSALVAALPTARAAEPAKPNAERQPNPQLRGNSEGI